LIDRDCRELLRPTRLPFEPPLVLAPMEGITKASIRALLARYGPIGLVCTEFVRVAGESVSRRHLAEQVEKAPGVALSVQIMGNDPTLMAEAAGVMALAGADVVDVNLGCPSKTAARKGVGAALLKDGVALGRLLGAMRGAVPGLFSAKLRAGFEQSDAALDRARVVEQSGADFLAVHPRRRVDYFEGIADWRIIRLLRKQLSIPVIGNGDVWYAADALRMLEETGCDGVMIGRPALRNPWISPDCRADGGPHASVAHGRRRGRSPRAPSFRHGRGLRRPSRAPRRPPEGAPRVPLSLAAWTRRGHSAPLQVGHSRAAARGNSGDLQPARP
jgi:nifR3 family TIM-barrel protein